MLATITGKPPNLRRSTLYMFISHSCYSTEQTDWLALFSFFIQGPKYLTFCGPTFPRSLESSSYPH